MSQVAKIEVGDNLKESIKEVVSQVGGFSSFIKKGEVVLLKPNFNTSDPYPASTDISFLKSVVELVYEAGAKLVMVGDSSTMTANTRKVMNKLEVFDLLDMEKPPRIYVFEEGNWIKKIVPGGKYLKSVFLPELPSFS